MFQTLLISFREGLEALLVVAIATLYLRRTGRVHLISAIRSGLAVAVAAAAISMRLRRKNGSQPVAAPGAPLNHA